MFIVNVCFLELSVYEFVSCIVQVGLPVCQALLAYGKQQYNEVRLLPLVYVC